MTIYPFRTASYARQIFIFGTNRLTARDGFTGIPTEYYTPVEQYVAANYTIEPYATTQDRTKQIDAAYTNGWINSTEQAETIAYIV